MVGFEVTVGVKVPETGGEEGEVTPTVTIAVGETVVAVGAGEAHEVNSVTTAKARMGIRISSSWGPTKASAARRCRP